MCLDINVLTMIGQTEKTIYEIYHMQRITKGKKQTFREITFFSVDLQEQLYIWNTLLYVHVDEPRFI